MFLFINVTYDLGWSTETVTFHRYYSISIVVKEPDKILQAAQAANACSQTTWCTLRARIFVFPQPAKHWYYALSTTNTCTTKCLSQWKDLRDKSQIIQCMHNVTILTCSCIQKTKQQCCSQYTVPIMLVCSGAARKYHILPGKHRI